MPNSLRWADREKIMNDHDRYKTGIINLSDFMETIENQIQEGEINLYNEKSHGHMRGTLNINKVKEILKGIESTIARLEKYSFEDADLIDTTDTLDQLEDIGRKLAELAETKSYFHYTLSEEEPSNPRKKRI